MIPIFKTVPSYKKEPVAIFQNDYPISNKEMSELVKKFFKVLEVKATVSIKVNPLSQEELVDVVSAEQDVCVITSYKHGVISQIEVFKEKPFFRTPASMKYLVTFADSVYLLTEEQLLDFVKVAVINNKDISSFSVKSVESAEVKAIINFFQIFNL